MKKTFIATLFFVFFTSLFLEASDVRTITKTLPTSGGTFLVLDDMTYWVMVPVAKKKRSFFQWLRGKQIPQPEENFLFCHADWKAGTMITIEEHNWTEENQLDMEKYHQPKIAMCPFQLKNIHNTQVAFARNIDLDEAFNLFIVFAQENYEAGKSKGYKAGFSNGWFLGNLSGYTLGHSAGCYEGYNRGYNDAYQGRYNP